MDDDGDYTAFSHVVGIMQIQKVRPSPSSFDAARMSRIEKVRKSANSSNPIENTVSDLSDSNSTTE